MKLLSDLYNVTLKRGIRGKAAEGFIRPTIGQNFMSDRDFEEVESHTSNIDFSKYSNITYVDVNNGSDITGDGTENKAYASVHVGIENSSDGEAVFIKKGTYQLQPIVVDPSLCSAGIAYFKNLDIIGENGKEVIMIWDGASVGAVGRDWPMFYVNYNNSNDILITNFTIKFFPKATSSNYSRAIWRKSYGMYKNLFIEVLGTHEASHSYFNGGPANTPVIENSTFYHNSGSYSEDYSGSPLYINCLSNADWDHGTKQYCVPNKAYDKVQYIESVSYTENDVDLANQAVGNNPDGSQAHVGVYGGKYAWGDHWNYSNDYVNYTSLDTLKMSSNTILSNIDRDIYFTEDGEAALSIIGKDSGKWYWEIKVISTQTSSTDAYCGVGIGRSPLIWTENPRQTGTVYLENNSGVWKNAVAMSSFINWAQSGTHYLGIALDLDNEEITFYKNEDTYGPLAISDLGGSGPIYALVGNRVRGSNNINFSCNFGQEQFQYNVPTNFNSGLY